MMLRTKIKDEPRECTVRDMLAYLGCCPPTAKVNVVCAESDEFFGVAKILRMDKDNEVWIVIDEEGEGFNAATGEPIPAWEELPVCELEGVQVSGGRQVVVAEKYAPKEPVDVCVGKRATKI